ncbi:MAG TPA: endolytic transglycosylase MltG [Ktedonobacteraceae bacterium]|nr:endolytic transglycosylase MltG [Ktedonobacteraceae bacterium]
MKKRGQRGAIVAVLLLGLLIFGGVYFAWSIVTDVFQPVSTDQGKTVVIVVQSGDGTRQIADELQAKGLIRNALAFRIWARIKGLDTHLQAGAYNLNTSMTIDAIIGQLLNAQPDDYVVSLPEGWRFEQDAKRLGAVGMPRFKTQEFLDYTKNPVQFPDAAKYPILKSIPAGDSMEGLLFPDTYLIPVNATARDVVNMMLTEFTDKVQQNHLEAMAKQNKMSIYQMVILASIVEREVIFEKDRPLVASVYWNRIYRPNNETVGLLDADPTVQYARDSQPGTTTYWLPLQDGGANIAPNSPWNTYVQKGFPPTPICNPGLASMIAASSPASTDYYFFLSKKDGTNVYAKTQAEFEADKQKYLP